MPRTDSAPHPAGTNGNDNTLLFDSTFLAKLEQLSLLARRLFRGEHRAERHSRHTGSSLEFADYRNYALGDDPRMIDWNIYARLDRLFVKLYEREQDLTIAFLMDTSASMHWSPPTPALETSGKIRPSKFNQARRIVAALSYIALVNHDRVNIHWCGDGLGGDMGFLRGKSQFHGVLNFLRKAPPVHRRTAWMRIVREFVQRQKKRGLVFLCSDMFDPAGFEEPLALLQRHQFEVHLLHVVDEAELEPQVSGDVELTDAETELSIEASLSEAVVGRYRAAVKSWLDRLDAVCSQRGIGSVRASTAVPFEDLVLRILREGPILK